MSGVVKSGPMQAYDDELKAYHLRLCEWLGLDPSKIMRLKDVNRPQTDPSPIAMPPGVDVTWQTINERHVAVEHDGRHPMPVSARMFDGVTTITEGLHLDWVETDRLRAEVGERPEFPAPGGGWPAHWPKP